MQICFDINKALSIVGIGLDLIAAVYLVYVSRMQVVSNNTEKLQEILKLFMKQSRLAIYLVIAGTTLQLASLFISW
jgi:hypothetical protein